MEENQGIKYMSDVKPDCETEFAEKFKGRYFFTPKKAGAQTAEANLNAGVAAAEQIVGFLEKGDATYQVNGWMVIGWMGNWVNKKLGEWGGTVLEIL